MQGLMMDYQLTLTSIMKRANQLFPNKEIRTKFGGCGLGVALVSLGDDGFRNRGIHRQGWRFHHENGVAVLTKMILERLVKYAASAVGSA